MLSYQFSDIVICLLSSYLNTQLPVLITVIWLWLQFQHTAARRRLLITKLGKWHIGEVSTHSHPKVAAEDGDIWCDYAFVSTHSPPKAAATYSVSTPFLMAVSTHRRPKAAAYLMDNDGFVVEVSTHSRPKAAASNAAQPQFKLLCFNTQPPEGGCFLFLKCFIFWFLFQHTAARRRLLAKEEKSGSDYKVSTHSRPKAAANPWFTAASKNWFQHTAARRRLQLPNSGVTFNILFQHTAARRRLLPT